MINIPFKCRIPVILECSRNNAFYFAPLEQWLADFVARYLAIINCSINFIIYCVVGSNFRKDLSVFWNRSRSQLSTRSTHTSNTCNNFELLQIGSVTPSPSPGAGGRPQCNQVRPKQKT